jgi:hypothetical protein
VRFDGPDLTAQDTERLSSQLLRVERLMRDGKWRSLAHIAVDVGGSMTGVSARLRDLRKPRFGGWRVERRKVHCESGWFEYRLLPPVPTGQGALWND